MILIDTNVFLEFMLGQQRAPECEALLNSVSTGESEATVTHFTIHAIEAILGGGDNLTAFLRNLEYSTGLYVYATNTSEEMSVGLLASEMKMDFDDALQYYVAKKIGAKAIVSFDKHLDGLDIARVEPGAIAGVKKKERR